MPLSLARALPGTAAFLVFTAVAIPRASHAQDAKTLYARIQWAQGPLKAALGSTAEVGVPAYCQFADADGAKLFMEATQNPVSGDEKGVMLCADARSNDDSWFIVFEYSGTGLVRDDEKSSLDTDAILESLRRGNDAGNEERLKRGWVALDLLGWRRAPYYDSLTNNLTWSTRVRERGDTSEFVNHSVRLLGRGGVMKAELVAAPEQFEGAVQAFDSILTAYSYVPGQRYAEWRDGDKVAGYGLTALIAGGAGVTAAKLGLFGKLWKFIVAIVIAGKKLIIVAVVGAAAFLKRLFSKPEHRTTHGG